MTLNSFFVFLCLWCAQSCLIIKADFRCLATYSCHFSGSYFALQRSCIYVLISVAGAQSVALGTGGLSVANHRTHLAMSSVKLWSSAEY